MKTLLLIFILLPLVGIAQLPSEQNLSKRFTATLLNKYLSETLSVTDNSIAHGELDILTADQHGELTSAFYSYNDKIFFVLVFYNDQFNKYGTEFKSYEFKTFKKDEAKNLLVFVNGLYGKYANTKEPATKNTYSLGNSSGLKIMVSHTGELGRELYVYWPEVDLIANWKIDNVRKALRRFERQTKKDSE